MSESKQDQIRELLSAIWRASLDGNNVKEFELSDSAVEICPYSPELLAVNARSLWLREREDESRSAMEKALSLGPEYAIVWASSAVIALNEARVDEALQSVEKALSLSIDYGWVYDWCCEVYQFCGEHDRVLELLDRWETSFPEDAEEIIYLRMWHLQSIGCLDEVAAMLKEAEARFPDSPRFQFKRAVKLMASHQLTESINVMQRAVERQSGSAVCWAQLASSLSLAGRYEDAERAAMRSLEINPRSTIAMGAMARVCAQSGDNSAADEWRSKAQKAIPVLALQVSLSVVPQAMKQGDWGKVLDITTPALSAQSHWTRRQALNHRVRAFIELSRIDEAQSVFDELDSMGWVDPSRYILGSRLLRLKGDDVGAQDTLNEGLRLYPTSGDLNALLIRLLHDIGRSEEENKVIESAMANPPDIPMGFTSLYTALDETGHPLMAKEILRIGKERFPNTQEFRLFDAVSKMERGDFLGAVRDAVGVKGDMKDVAQLMSDSAVMMEESRQLTERLNANPKAKKRNFLNIAKWLLLSLTLNMATDKIARIKKIRRVIAEIKSKSGDDGSTIH